MDDDKKEKKVRRTREELEEEIFKLQSSLPNEISVPKMFMTDTTSEGLQQQLLLNGGFASVISDEGNLFEIVGGLYSDGRTNLDVFLQGHSGGALRVIRKDSDRSINNIAVTLGLAIQPQVLRDVKSANKKAFKGRGLLARMLFCIPKSNVGTRDVRNRKSIKSQTKNDFENGIKQLLVIPYNRNALGVVNPRRLVLDSAALEKWFQFSEYIEGEMNCGGRLDSLKEFGSKLPGQALRIAGLSHVADSVMRKRSGLSTQTLSALSSPSHCTEKEICVETMDSVIALCKKLIDHTTIAMELIETDDSDADAKAALEWIKSNCKQHTDNSWYFKRHELHTSSRFKKTNVDRVVKALSILISRNMISPECHIKFSTRSTLIHYINPSLITG